MNISEIERELQAEHNAMETIFQAIVNHGGIIKWVSELLKCDRYKSIEETYDLFKKIENHYVKLEKYEKALYIKNGFSELLMENS